MSLFENAYSDQAANIGERLNEMNNNAGEIARARVNLAVSKSQIEEKKDELPISSDEGMGELGLSGAIGAFPGTQLIGSAGKAYLKSGTQKLFKSAIQRLKVKKGMNPETNEAEPIEDIDPSTINTAEDGDAAYAKLNQRLNRLTPDGQQSALDDFDSDFRTTAPLGEEDLTDTRINVDTLQDAIKTQEAKGNIAQKPSQPEAQAEEGGAPAEAPAEPALEDIFPAGSEPHPAPLDDASGTVPRAPTNTAGEIIEQQGQVGTQGAEEGTQFSKALAKVQGIDTEADNAASQIGKFAGEDATGLEADEIAGEAGSILSESTGILGSIGGAVGTAMGFLGPLGVLAGIGMGIFGAVKEAQAHAQEMKVDSEYAKAQKQVGQLEATAGEAPSFSVGSMSMPVADSASFRAGQAHF